MKICNYCKQERPDDLEICCGLSDFTPIPNSEPDPEPEVVEDEFFEEEDMRDFGEDDEEELPEVTPQPSAHGLLVELCQVVDLDSLPEPDVPLPQWILDIPYQDLREEAIERHEEENPSLAERIKRYLGE